MTVAIKVGSVAREVGAGSFFHAFFSTIAGNLEGGEWGGRFPTLMGDFYRGSLRAGRADAALRELEQAKQELSKLTPDRVIWDIEDPTVAPPWGLNISPEITDLSNYFITSRGVDLFDVIEECLRALKSSGGELTVISI